MTEYTEHSVVRVILPNWEFSSHGFRSNWVPRILALALSCACLIYHICAMYTHNRLQRLCHARLAPTRLHTVCGNLRAMNPSHHARVGPSGQASSPKAGRPARLRSKTLFIAHAGLHR